MFLVLQIKRINEYKIHFESEMIKATLEVAFMNFNHKFYFTSCINFLIKGETIISNAPAINA